MLDQLKVLLDELKQLKRDIASESKKTINKKALREKAEELGTKWFADISEVLSADYGISQDTVEHYSISFGRLIKISAPNNLKTSYEDTLKALTSNYRKDFIIPIQTNPKGSTKSTLLESLLKDLPDEKESTYLEEAIACSKHNYLRAAAILGWCAAIDRIHRIIEKEGFAKFNITSADMASQKKGRFKRFNSVQNVNSISELREVFDSIILWIIEGMGKIDSNQHTRLRSCFDLRCQCAHPGDAPVTEYNLLSFYSDINEIILKNPNFEV